LAQLVAWSARHPYRLVEMHPRVWLFLPTYNEAENLDAIVRATTAQLEAAAPGEWRLLVVDDASPDGTGDLADRLAGEVGGVEVLHRDGKEGLGAAYLAGFEYALTRGAEYVIVMDADFSHDPRHLPAMIEAAEDSDLVLGSRYVAGGEITNWPRLRRVLSRSGSLYARLMLGVKVRDLTTGFRCVRRRVLETVEPSTLRSQGYVFNIELTYRALLAGFTVKEIPICFRDREEGESKMSLPIAVEALRLVPKLRGLRTEVVEQRSNGAVRSRRVRWRSPRWPRRRDGILGMPGADAAGESPKDPDDHPPVSRAAPQHASAPPRTRG
jgi:dolichol-phosphate mannosyltransferase